MNFKRHLNSDQSVNYYELINSSENISLVINHIAKLVKAHYNAALNVGNHKDKYFKDQELALLYKDSLIPLKGSQKRILKQIEYDELKDYIITNKIDLKDIKSVNQMISNFKK